jgi:hypothetical protein
MSSAERARAQLPANKLYINIAAIQSSIFTETGAAASWVADATAVGMLSTAGSAILRDMGVTKYLPAPEVPGAAFKVQLVYPGDDSAIGYNATAGNYYTGYIKMGAQTFGGAIDETCAKVARLN